MGILEKEMGILEKEMGILEKEILSLSNSQFQDKMLIKFIVYATTDTYLKSSWSRVAAKSVVFSIPFPLHILPVQRNTSD